MALNGFIFCAPLLTFSLPARNPLYTTLSIVTNKVIVLDSSSELFNMLIDRYPSVKLAVISHVVPLLHSAEIVTVLGFPLRLNIGKVILSVPVT